MKKIFCLFAIAAIFGLSSSILITANVATTDNAITINQDAIKQNLAVYINCQCTVGEKRDCTVSSGDAKDCKGTQECIKSNCAASASSSAQLSGSVRTIDTVKAKVYNGTWGECKAVEQKCDENCDGTAETCKSTSSACKSCVCTPTGSKRACSTSEGCAGEQECTVSGWSDCQSSLKFCDTNCDNIPDKCLSECTTFECTKGQIRTCNASSGCTGIQNCTSCLWDACISDLVKCDTNADGTPDKCMEPPCPGKCTSNDNCNNNEICSNNKCTTLTCSEGQKAQNHQCTAVSDSASASGNCTSSDNCKDNENCTNSKCTPLTCSEGQKAQNHQCQKSDEIPIALIAFAAVFVIIIIVLIFLWIKPSKLDLSANPADIPADGKSASTIIITVKNMFGKALSSKKDINVTLSSTGGKIPNQALIPKGSASITAVLTSSATPGAVKISASAENLSGSADVNFKSSVKRYCMHCGAQMISDVDPCPRCGKLPPSGVDTKNCPNCNAVIPSIAGFCKVCGAGQPK